MSCYIIKYNRHSEYLQERSDLIFFHVWILNTFHYHSFSTYLPYNLIDCVYLVVCMFLLVTHPIHQNLHDHIPNISFSVIQKQFIQCFNAIFIKIMTWSSQDAHYIIHAPFPMSVSNYFEVYLLNLLYLPRRQRWDWNCLRIQ